MKFLVSADLGQAVGYTAIAVSDRILKPAGEAETDRVFDNVRGHFRGSYPADRWSSANTSDAWRGLPCSRPIQIAERLVRLVRLLGGGEREPYRRGGRGRIGGGRHGRRGVADILVKEVEETVERGKPRVRFLPVIATGGDTVTLGGGFYRVPKRDLIHAGVVAFQDERLKIGRDVELKDVLINELLNYMLTVNTKTVHDTYQPWRESEHDDLLFAICLGTWGWERAII
jgi:hypothetical protein